MPKGDYQNWSTVVLKSLDIHEWRDGGQTRIEIIQRYCDGEKKGSPQLVKQDYYMKDGKMTPGKIRGMNFDDLGIIRDHLPDILQFLSIDRNNA